MTIHRCADCRYSHDGESPYLECRRHPPVVNVVGLTDRAETTTNWPTVTADEWCGEFRANLRPHPAG